jgi:hypothetical protein
VAVTDVGIFKKFFVIRFLMTEEKYMKDSFSQSKELREIIERFEWTLYDVTRPKGIAFKWEGLEGESPADQYDLDHHYLFVPVPKKGQTPKDAYSVTMGLGPSLLVEDHEDERWDGLRIDKATYELGIPIAFTRLWFHKECLVAFTPQTDFYPDPDDIGIKYERVIDTFEKYFRIITPEEFARTHSIIVPGDPGLN